MKRTANLLHLGDHTELEDLFTPRVPQHSGQEANVVEPACVDALLTSTHAPEFAG